MTDKTLLKKYAVAGPRYTSYPTVPYWEKNPTPEEWIESLKNSLKDATQKNTGASIYIHIPFCESLCTYCGCNTRITRNHGVSMPYVETLLKEWKLYQEKLGLTQTPLHLSELHLGGGTPTFMTSDELKTLLVPLLESCQLQPGYEFSVEADPRVTSHDQLETLSKLGFKRLSLGIQDFDPKVQETVHRIQSIEQVRKLMESARKLGFTSINFDLIYGLPFQTLQSVEKTIQTVTDFKELRPDRIAFYSYAHVPWIKASQRRFSEADLPPPDLKRALYEKGRELLEAASYFEIGMDHFALKTDSLWKATQSHTLHRNFMGYTSQHVSPVIPLGVSAIGDSWNVFMQNEKLLETYKERVHKNELPIFRGHVLNTEDQILRKHLLNLMTLFKTDWKKDLENCEFLKTVPEKLVEFKKDGLLDFTETSCTLTKEGIPFLRNICMSFDARLIRKEPATQLFSKTI